MFRNIFLPERVGSYYLFATRTIALEFTKTSILCSVMVNSRKNERIELCIEEPISQDQSVSAGERIGSALKNIISKAGKADHTVALLPGNSAVIKETTLPFSDPEKIRLVAPYEVEGSLPFSLSESLFDAISLNGHEGSTRALVAAMRATAYSDYAEAFAYANFSPDRVTLDIVELIPLARHLAQANHDGVSILCDIGTQSSKVISSAGGNVRLIRTVSRGTNQIAQSFEGSGTENSIPQELTFTLDAARLGRAHSDCIIHLSGLAAEDTAFAESLAQITGITVERVSPRKIFATSSPIQARYITSLEAARHGTAGLSIDRLREEDRIGTIRAHQAVVAAVIGGISFIALIAYSIIMVRGMSGEAYASEQEAVERLRKIFALSARNSTSLEQSIANAERELSKEENIWFALSSRNRFSFLSYLQELSTRIDREAIGLEIRRFVMRTGDSGGDDTLTIEGSVKDYDALRALEEALIDSKLFRVVPKLQETKFVISLVIDKKGGEG